LTVSESLGEAGGYAAAVAEGDHLSFARADVGVADLSGCSLAACILGDQIQQMLVSMISR